MEETVQAISLLGVAVLPLSNFILGMVHNYEIRKISARLQSRRGPWLLVPKAVRQNLGTTRLFQPLYDVLKLLYKESFVPETSRVKIFKAAPYAALICLVAATTLTPFGGYSPFANFDLSLVALLYLLLGVPLALIMGGAASSSPWAVMGSQREAELMLAYETPLVISAFTVSVMANTLSIHKILTAQAAQYVFIFLNPFAASAFLLAVVGKLHLKPFDIPEAEVEIVAGPITEYSGSLLGIIEIGKILMTSICIGLFVNLFLAGGNIPGLSYPLTIVTFVLESLVIVLLVTLIHTLNPRLRIDQALDWYVKVPTLLAVIGLVWAYALCYMHGITIWM
jgi:NADH-quinone oxidoreductase subunit H